MEHKDAAIKAEMLENEIEEIKANMESVQARLANITEGPIREEFAKDLADMKEELAAREKDLAAARAAVQR
ncbi:MAG TPA: hypothetical protein VN915_14495 [Elusimicrobiota bacterium]|nr:hypothetical protein [Elusimicrobiota bacterium]